MVETRLPAAVLFIHDWFKRQGLTLCCAESLTGGHLQATLTSLSGASTFFRGGITAYNQEVKAKVLGVDAAHAAAVNAVSPAVAVQMAFGACQLFNADLALATTGYAQPNVARGVTVPFAYAAIVRDDVAEPLLVTQIEGQAEQDRVAMQMHVTEKLLQQCVEVLSRAGAGR